MRSVQNALNRRKKGEKGFTLVELLVVVIIIGILAAVAVPIYLNQRKSAWRASVESDVKNASLVLETIAEDNNGEIVVPGGHGATCPPACYVSVVKTTPAGTLGFYDKDSASHDRQKIVVSKDNTLQITREGTNEYKIIGWNSNLGGDAGHPNVTYRSSDGTLSTN
ncbi:type IV pilin protein [Bifidobacterium thermophilum]|uniref:Type II secretion system protein n=1 Tax=Bifidobacterium thermophilum TaxID=33905 RepID=A0A7X9NTF2_9BIFI|nr:type II secretion system protein [Bifidobacterium thermophilum]NME62427.1 type II secretion system protein [Bifidobacterium thermophilum]